jgi:ABC-type xylose transport system permease subunit
MKTVKDRWSAKTPTFWKKVQKVGLVAGAVGGILIAAPIALPVTLVTLGGYLVTAGGVAAALSQLTVEDKEDLEK